MYIFMARIELLKRLDLFEPTSIELGSDDKVVFSIKEKKYKYYTNASNDFFCEYFYHYPIIVDDDGSLWKEANLYLLDRINCFNPVKQRTLESIANDLLHFRRWLLLEEIDFLNITRRPRTRPTYRYTAFLHNEIRINKLKPSTAKRHISNIQNFYRWLEKDGINFNFPLWEEKNLNVAFKNAYGFLRSKDIVSTNLTRSFKTHKSSDDDEYIYDGGKLRPLTKQEQEILITSLISINNIEMTLAFLVALTTGARLQTVFTLRRCDFEMPVSEKATVIRIKVGSGTLVDTKFNKQMVIIIPSWLYDRMKIYLNSKKYEKRKEKSKHTYKNKLHQYAFLTRSGSPYYLSQNDPNQELYRYPPRGNSIQQFIRQQLRPLILQSEHTFEIRFHDLRATFGMNLLESKLQGYSAKDYSTNEPELFNILNFIRTRLGHSQLRTTEAYLNYKRIQNLSTHVQDEFELYLKSMMEGDTK